ncbi:N-acetylmuramoyl-L-alanine amidase [Thermocatellispora tengchongensis]
MPRSRTCAFALAALLPLITAATPSSTPFVPPAGEDPRQAAYAEAARTYGVPEEILLAVSYLQSRWDTHAGRPSTAGGYGPMHLTAPVELPPRAPDDLRGDGSVPAHAPIPRATTTTTDQIALAARLTGLSPAALRTDPAANIRGGAALLAHHHRRLAPTAPAGDLAGWREAIAAYASPTPGSGASFANEVFATIRTGATRTTDDGHRVRLRPAPVPDPAPFRDSAAECPPEIACDWLPAAHRTYAKGRYGNHDRTLDGRRIDYIVIHDGETTYDAMTRLRRDPKYVSWHYTLRSQDGQVAQHVRTRDIAWHSGNWYVNTHSIGLEHEGYLASGGTWYTEAMYRSSARLVRYLADKYDIPLDRAHILGHDNVPGTTPATVRGMHVDPGPYWDWAHYFTLLGAP